MQFVLVKIVRTSIMQVDQEQRVESSHTITLMELNGWIKRFYG